MNGKTDTAPNQLFGELIIGIDWCILVILLTFVDRYRPIFTLKDASQLWLSRGNTNALQEGVQNEWPLPHNDLFADIQAW